REPQRQCRTIDEHPKPVRFNRAPNQPAIPCQAYEGIMGWMEREPLRLPFMLGERGFDAPAGGIEQPNAVLGLALAFLASTVVAGAHVRVISRPGQFIHSVNQASRPKLRGALHLPQLAPA